MLLDRIARSRYLPHSLVGAEVLVAAGLGVASALALVAVAPSGGDAPAHVYRVFLVREGVYLWDNLWFAGTYPLASYSLLYYLPAALLGNVVLVVAAVVASAGLFASLAVREWGEAARWPVRAFAVLASAPLFTGTYSYALGLAALLGSLRALQAGRGVLALLLAALTLGVSPLAFAFLCLAWAAAFFARRGWSRRTLALAAGLLLVACLELAVLLLFPTEGIYPFEPWILAGTLGVAGSAAALAWSAPRARPLAVLFLLWALAALAGFLVPSPLGGNLARLNTLVFPLVLLSALLARFRPRPLAVAALAAAFAFNLAPYLVTIPARADGDQRAARRAFWEPALRFLRDHRNANYRVEVVPTYDHWEAYFLPRAGFALARGWYRQLDLAANPALYRTPLTADAYRAWLRRLGVRYVLLADARLGLMGAAREARLLRSGRSGLALAFRSRDWTIYRLPDPAPILTGPRAAALSSLGHERIAGWTGGRGAYRLRVRYSRYLRVRAGPVCLRPAGDGMTTLVARAPGRFLLAPAEKPAALIRSLLDRDGAGC